MQCRWRPLSSVLSSSSPWLGRRGLVKHTVEEVVQAHHEFYLASEAGSSTREFFAVNRIGLAHQATVQLRSRNHVDLSSYGHPFSLRHPQKPLLQPLHPNLNKRTLSRHHGHGHGHHHHDAPAEIVLRPYQELCLESCTEALASGSTRIGVSLPTGAGKTTVFVSLLARIAPPPTNKEATRALIVVNSIELARQAAAQVRRMFPDWVVELEQGQKHVATGLADVTIATYQTLNNEHRLMKFDPKTMKAIIIDEAHHAAAPSYRRLLSQFDPEVKHPEGSRGVKPPHKIPIIGFSATFSRHDGIALGSVFERIVYHRDFLEMIKEQWLCDVRFTSVKATLNLSKVAVNPTTRDFNTTSLANVVNSETMNHLVVRSWLDRAGERKSTLVFCVNIQHVKDLTQTYRGYGVDARYITASTAKNERQDLVESFKNGEFPVLVNCAILTEGADIPNVDCVVLARPTRSRNLFAQMVGRGMRLSPGTRKTDCRIIDFVDSHSRVGTGIISVPMLFGMDPGEFDIDDETVDSLEERIAAREARLAAEKEKAELEATERTSDELLHPVSYANYSVPNPFDVTYIDHDNAFNLVEEIAQDNAGRRISSRFAWVNCGEGVWVLALHEKGFIRVEPIKLGVDDDEASFIIPEADVKNMENPDAVSATDNDNSGSGSDVPTPSEPLFKAEFTKTVGTAYRNSRTILSRLPLADAVRACDHFVVNRVYNNSSPAVLQHSAAWRKKPASDAQIDVIKKVKKPSDDFEVNFEELTKGQAATIITRLRHGGLARFNKQKKEAEKAAKAAEAAKNEMMRQTQASDPVRYGLL